MGDEHDDDRRHARNVARGCDADGAAQASRGGAGFGRGSKGEQAFNRYCEGARPVEIATELGVTAATVRKWLREYLRALALEVSEEQADRLMRGIQGQWAVANEAWKAYRDERERTGGRAAPFLALASRAEREAARMQDVYDRIKPAVDRMEFVMTRRPDGPENLPAAAPTGDTGAAQGEGHGEGHGEAERRGHDTSA